MVFDVATEIGGLFGFLRKYGALFEEIIQILNGFSTQTPGVYNPVNDPNRWKNIKGKPYYEEEFEFNVFTPLTVIGTNNKHKSFPLKILKGFDFIKSDKVNILDNLESIDISPLTIIKEKLFKDKIQKLKILKPIDEKNVNPLTFNKSIEREDYTPIKISTWLKSEKSTKLGVLSWMKSGHNERVHERTYITDDVGTISDIELIELIGSIENAS